MHPVQETKHTNHNGSQLYVAELNQYYKPWEFISLDYSQNTGHQTGTVVYPGIYAGRYSAPHATAATIRNFPITSAPTTPQLLSLLPLLRIAPTLPKPHQRPDLLLSRNQTIQTMIVYKVMLQHLIYGKGHQRRPVAGREPLRHTTICYPKQPNPDNTNYNGSRACVPDEHLTDD